MVAIPRKAGLDAPGTLHHVMAQGIEGIDIFRPDEDRNDFLNRLTCLPVRDRSFGGSRGAIETGAEDQRRGEGDGADLSVGGKEVRIYGSKHFPFLGCDDLPSESVRCL